MCRSRQVLTGMSVIALLALLVPGVAAHGKGTARIPVVVYNNADLPPAVLAESEQIADRIYGEIGIELIWTDAPAMPAGDRDFDGMPMAHPIYVMLKTDHEQPQGREADVLGRAFRGAYIAWIMCSRADRTARLRGLPLAPVIGHVMAHEIGHLLLPAGGHSKFGIMQAVLDLDLAARNDLWFDAGQANAIRARLLASQ